MLLDLYPYRASAHSGVSRLELYRLQEQALLKRAVKEAADKVVEQETKKDEQVERKEASRRKSKTASRKFAVVEQVQPETFFRRKPIFRNTTPVNENFPLWVLAIDLQLQTWYAEIVPLRWIESQVIIEPSKAANDADYRLRILLLAA